MIFVEPLTAYNRRRTLSILWFLVFAALPVWMAFDPPGWDVAIYHSAIRALAAGHDPYADAIAIQQLFHRQMALHPHADPPYSYVYSPLTLPLLRLVGTLPGWLTGGLYWLLYAVAVLTQVWVGLRSADPRERPTFLYLAPLAAFFPGLLANGIVLSGNIAYLLYAMVLLAAVFAWRGASWRWFYLATLAASCVKAPLLSLVVIPVFSARKQAMPASLTALLGVALFAIQPRLWPALFAHYLQAVELQFTYNRDFGCSPAGLFSGVLYDRGIPYSPAALFFYACYAVPLLLILFALSRRFQRGSFPLTRWVPVLLVGVILLNPRLIEYDVAPLTIPLALIAWRALSSILPPRQATLTLAVLFLLANAFALTSWETRKLIDGPLLVVLFAAGAWNLLQTPQVSPSPSQGLSTERGTLV